MMKIQNCMSHGGAKDWFGVWFSTLISPLSDQLICIIGDFAHFGSVWYFVFLFICSRISRIHVGKAMSQWNLIKKYFREICETFSFSPPVITSLIIIYIVGHTWLWQIFCVFSIRCLAWIDDSSRKYNCKHKQDHQWWRYHRRLLDCQSPYFQLIIE